MVYQIKKCRHGAIEEMAVVPVDILHRNVNGSRRAIVNSVLDAEMPSTDEFIVFPNPFSSGDFVVRYDGVIDKRTYLRILNLSGTEVLRTPVTRRETNISTRNHLTPGIYLV